MTPDIYDPSAAPMAVSILSIWVLGISVGLTACTATCLPFMGALVIGAGTTPRQAFVQTGSFAIGKIMAYTLLGGTAGYLGEMILDIVEGNLGHWMIGGVSILAGLFLVHAGKISKSCMASRFFQNAPPLALGFVLSFVPCAPLAALLASAALAGNPLNGLMMGLMFGLGAALTPLFVIVPLLGRLGREMTRQNPTLFKWIRWLSAFILIALGVRRILLVW